MSAKVLYSPFALYFSLHTGLSACARAAFQRRTAAWRQLCDPRFPPHPACPGWDSPGHRWWRFSVSPPLPPARHSGHAAPPDAQIPGLLRFLGRRHLTPLSARPGPPRMLPSVGHGTAPAHELARAGPVLPPCPQSPKFPRRAPAATWVPFPSGWKAYQ